MNVLVCPMNLRLGGSQIVAIELAAGIRDRGHRVVLCSDGGPMEDLASDRRLPLVLMGTGRRGAVRAIRECVRRERIDLVHAYERARTLQAFVATVVTGTPLVGSIMTMGVPPGLPRTASIVVGTRQLYDDLKGRWPGRLALVEPPVNMELDRPGVVDGSSFRRRYGAEGVTLLVLVSRLSAVMKLEGVTSAIASVERIARDLPVRLVIVGGGAAEAEVRSEAERANARLGRAVITMAGRMHDPRAAYDAADIVLGQSTAVLRGMAFEKPGIVLGEDGFTEIFTPETLDHFLHVGLYGLGGGGGSVGLERQLRRLIGDPGWRRQLGRYARGAVEEHFGLDVAARRLERVYLEAIKHRPGAYARFIDASRTTVGLARARLGNGAQRRQGRDRMREVSNGACDARFRESDRAVEGRPSRR